MLSGIAFDSAGNIYLAGASSGANPASFGATPPNTGSTCGVPSEGPPVFNFAGVPFVVELTPDASSVRAAAYLDGACVAPQVSIGVSASGAVWMGGTIAGYVPPPGFTTLTPLQLGGPGFLTAWNPGLSQFLFTSYFNSVTGLAPGTNGAAYLSGQTGSSSIEASESKKRWVNPSSQKSSLPRRRFPSTPCSCRNGWSRFRVRWATRDRPR